MAVWFTTLTIFAYLLEVINTARPILIRNFFTVNVIFSMIIFQKIPLKLIEHVLKPETLFRYIFDIIHIYVSKGYPIQYIISRGPGS